MDSAVSFAVYSLSLFLGMLLLLELGRRVALRRRASGSDKEPASIAAIEGAVFALFGLLAWELPVAMVKFSQLGESSITSQWGLTTNPLQSRNSYFYIANPTISRGAGHGTCSGKRKTS